MVLKSSSIQSTLQTDNSHKNSIIEPENILLKSDSRYNFVFKFVGDLILNKVNESKKKNMN